MPYSKGQLITMNLDGTDREYRILKLDGNIAEVVCMSSVGKSTFGGNNTYAGSSLDTYLNSTWYNTLTAAAKAAIVSKTFNQDGWYWGTSGSPVYSGHYGPTVPGTNSYSISKDSDTYGDQITRNVYALSVQDVIDYITDTDVGDGKLENYNIWKMFWNMTTQPSDLEYPWLRSADPSDTSIGWGAGYSNGDIVRLFLDNNVSVRPALTVDLSKIFLPRLDTPQNVTASGTVVSFDPVENATSYDVYADDTTLLGNVTSQSSVDLATLPGWSSLSGGPHNITIVAKADWYEDSEKSAGVEVTRGAWTISDNINPRATRLVLGVYNVVNGEIGTLAQSYTMDIQPGMIVPIPDTRAMTGGVKFIGWLDDGAFNASDLSAITYGTGINPLSDRYGAVWQSATYASKDDVPASMVIDETAKAFATVKFNFASVPEGTAKIKINTSGYPSVYNATTMKVTNTASYSSTTIELASWITTLFAE